MCPLFDVLGVSYNVDHHVNLPQKSVLFIFYKKFKFETQTISQLVDSSLETNVKMATMLVHHKIHFSTY